MRNRYWTLVEGHMAILHITAEQAAELMATYPTDTDCRLQTGPVPLDRLLEWHGCHIDVFEDCQSFIERWLLPEMAGE